MDQSVDKTALGKQNETEATSLAGLSRGTAEYAMCCHRALSLKRPQRRRETSHWSAEQAVIGRSYTSPALVIVLGKPQMPKTFF